MQTGARWAPQTKLGLVNMSDLKRLSLMTVAVCAVTTSTALAQGGDYYSRDKYQAVRDRAQPEFDPEPVRLGAFLVRPSAELGLTYTDNVFAAPANEESGTIGLAGLRVSGDSNWNVHALGFDASVLHNEYFDQGAESHTDLLGRLRGRFDVTREFSLGGSVFAEQRTEPRTDFVSGFGIDAPIEYTRQGVTLDANLQNDRFRWTNRVGVTGVNYDDGTQIGTGLPIDQDYRDRTITEGRTRLSYGVSPNLAVFGQATYSDSRYYENQFLGGAPRRRDSTGYTVSGGVDFELTALVRGDIAVGYLQEDKDDPFFSDITGLSLDGRLQWFPTQLTTVGFEAGRQVVDTGAFDAPSALQTRYGARIDHELRRNVILTARANWQNYEYEETDREDDFLDLGLLATYKMNKRVHLEAFVTRTDRDVAGFGVFGDPSYAVNTLGVGVTLYP